MKLSLNRRWFPLLGAFAAYIAWDLVDHQILTPRSPAWLCYMIDWGVAGMAGWSIFVLLERQYQRAIPMVDSTTINLPPAVFAQLTQAAQSLQSEIQELQQAIGNSINEEGIQQQRNLRQALVASYRAQAILEEVSGIVDKPQVTPPPVEQLITQRS
ncbi:MULTISPECIES: hypothetical protein [Herpetosiphon]|uniref:Uncharacterized protein n=1 Tax=Herpetosiphon geysericola TaxID=70996 RepID=A0A0P6XNY3_9CHLR|nr:MULTISPECIES: hypothetical protein [Herpetosiphon]KPL85393.1 hypothetical protein SE18_17220 [Herpetosiphon geysericola]MBM7841669.1 hypothetical protein [Herpetosiphon giganteus]